MDRSFCWLPFVNSINIYGLKHYLLTRLLWLPRCLAMRLAANNNGEEQNNEKSNQAAVSLEAAAIFAAGQSCIKFYGPRVWCFGNRETGEKASNAIKD